MKTPHFNNLDEAKKYVIEMDQTIKDPTTMARDLLLNQEYSDLPSVQAKEERKKIKDLVKNSKTTRDGLYLLAQTLISRFKIKTIGEVKAEIHIYKDGTYSLGLRTVMAHIQHTLDEICTKARVEEILSMIKNMTVTERDEIKPSKYLINLQNGVYNLKAGRLEKHSPDHFFFNKIPVDYDPKATCPKIDKVINELLSKEDTNLVYEWLGYCLFKDYFIKKAMIFVGEKDTGKSTVLKIFGKFMGEDNISGVSLQQIGSSFAMASFYNRSMNLVDDLSFDDVNNNGAFKTVTGNGIMTAEYKFGNRFNFVNYSKLTFACNKIPNIKDTNDEAYFIRWIIVRFDSPIKVKNKLLLEEVLSPEEMSGLLNKALQGLDIIMGNQDFTYDKTAEEIKTEMLMSGSSIAEFAFERLAHEDDVWITKQGMYEEYVKFCHQRKLPVETIKMFGSKIRDSASYIVESKTTINEAMKQQTVWRNVVYKEETNEKTNENYKRGLQ